MNQRLRPAWRGTCSQQTGPSKTPQNFYANLVRGWADESVPFPGNTSRSNASESRPLVREKVGKQLNARRKLNLKVLIAASLQFGAVV